MPTWIASGRPSRASQRSLNAPTRSCSRSAASNARSGSSSWATGAPNTAITASPTNFSTKPSRRWIVAAISSNSSDCKLRTSSGSSSSLSDVKPQRSANSTVTGRRSDSGSAGADTSRVPHFGQKANSAEASNPQAVQATSSPQVPRPAGTEGAGHRTAALLATLAADGPLSEHRSLRARRASAEFLGSGAPAAAVEIGRHDPRAAARRAARRAAVPSHDARGASVGNGAGVLSRLQRSGHPHDRDRRPDARGTRHAGRTAARACADRLRARTPRGAAARISGALSGDPARPVRQRRGHRPGEAGLRRGAADLSAEQRRAGVATAVPGAPGVLRVARLPQAARHAETSARLVRAPARVVFGLSDTRPLDLSPCGRASDHARAEADLDEQLGAPAARLRLRARRHRLPADAGRIGRGVQEAAQGAARGLPAVVVLVVGGVSANATGGIQAEAVHRDPRSQLRKRRAAVGPRADRAEVDSVGVDRRVNAFTAEFWR